MLNFVQIIRVIMVMWKAEQGPGNEAGASSLGSRPKSNPSGDSESDICAG